MRAIALALFFCLCAPPGVAGPWPRDTGAWFVATGGTYRFDLGTGLAAGEGVFFAEYGLRRRITLGLDAMQVAQGPGQALVFLRIPLLPADRRLQLAAGVGLGAVDAAGTWAGMGRLSLAVGRDHRLGRGGWWTVTTAVEADAVTPDPLAKIDASFGLTLSPRLTGLVQVEASGRDSASAEIALIPGLILRTGPNTRLHLGVEARTGPTQSAGLRLGLWREF